jgi:hypothetical protein
MKILPCIIAAAVLCIPATQALAQDASRAIARSPAPGSAATSKGHCVEPLSRPVWLSMTADEVVRALGKPQSDNRAFGGGLTFPGLRVMFDTSGKEIWTFTITGDTRLACGAGVGDALAKVRSAFPGGSMVYNIYKVQTGPYEVSFHTASGQVNEISIRPSGRRFVDVRAGAAPAPAAAIDVKRLAGQWIDPKNGQSFEIRPDGRYRTGVGGEGKVEATAEGLAFSGALSAWNQGKATITADGSAIEFYWTNAQGAIQYFAFLRAK